MPRSVVGFDVRLPDFTDCSFTTSEADFDWNAVVHLGGPARALDRRMPAFGEALSPDEIQRALDHIRGFCPSEAWPHGDLNLPRPLLTAKAFPENEAVVSVAEPFEHFIETRFVLGRRVGPRSQIELAVPFNLNRAFGAWQRGLGDVAIGFKHAFLHSRPRGAIVSGAVELTLPTGNEMRGLGDRLTVLEPYGTYSQMLAADTFVHLQAGLETPLNLPVNKELYWRAAGGKTFVQGQRGRTWTPMVELAGRRELAFDERISWDLLPQLQVTLSRRQHISISGGVLLPLTLHRFRRSTPTVQLLWDWFDGGFFEGWR
jgi:hypothetical protein